MTLTPPGAINGGAQCLAISTTMPLETLRMSRGPMTVADLVALMLAHDTDQLGLLVAGTPAEG